MIAMATVSTAYVLSSPRLLPATGQPPRSLIAGASAADRSSGLLLMLAVLNVATATGNTARKQRNPLLLSAAQQPPMAAVRLVAEVHPSVDPPDQGRLVARLEYGRTQIVPSKATSSTRKTM